MSGNIDIVDELSSKVPGVVFILVAKPYFPIYLNLPYSIYLRESITWSACGNGQKKKK